MASTLYGQNKKVAVYVTGDSEFYINTVVGAELVAAITNQSGYVAIERTADFLKELQKEQGYQRSGNVDDNQISALGKQFGVDYVCVADLTKIYGSYFISARLINVETAEVEKTADGNGNFNNDLNKLISISEQLASDIFSDGKAAPTINKKQEKVQQRQLIKKKRKKDYLNEKSDYISPLGLITGYPLKLALSFSGRHGGIIGIGYYANIGAEWGNVSVYARDSIYDNTYNHKGNITLTRFCYEVGIKLFLYKNLFLSYGYGTLGYMKNSSYYYDYNDNDVDGGFSRATETCKINRKQWQSNGLTIAAGYDLIFTGDPSLFLSFNAGVAYDIKNREWVMPFLRLTLGIGRKL